jgi:hypothetical protein
MNEQQPETVQTNIYKPCVICGNPGVEKHSELLPDRGVLIKVIHDNGKICEFVEYASISSFMERGKKKKDPKMMDCPRCGHEGRIGNYRPKKASQSHKWDYFIVHEQLEGFWGKNCKIKRRRRCYMKTERQRRQILTKLGRYNV